MTKQTAAAAVKSVCGHYGYDASCRAAAASKGSVAELIRLGVRLG